MEKPRHAISRLLIGLTFPGPGALPPPADSEIVICDECVHAGVVFLVSVVRRQSPILRAATGRLCQSEREENLSQSLR